MARVFISYRQLNDPQKLRRVREFAEQLRRCGIEVILDQFYLEEETGGPPLGWPHWCSEQATNAEQVLIIGDEPWFRCFDGTEKPGTGLGAACEGGEIRQRLHDKGGHNDIVRIAYFARSDLDHISHTLKRYHPFHVVEDFAGLIRWLGGTVPSLITTSDDSILTWPSPLQDFETKMANRHEEFKFFKGTLTEKASHRATLLSADTNYGKTRLVTEFWRYGSKLLGEHACSLIDFKSHNAFTHLCDALTLDLKGRLPRLTDRTPTKLQEALRKVREPVLIILDTFESATEDARNFVQGTLLAELNRTNTIRLVIAGQPQAIPAPGKNPWQDYVRRFDLPLMRDPRPWVEWARHTYPNIPPHCVKTIVLSTEGAPGAIATQLENLSKYPATQLKPMRL